MISFVIVFLSASLLFLIQPMIAKILLPFFGGGAAVWTGCMFFFQTVLLLGYGYAHWLSQRKTLKNQIVIHLTLWLFACIIVLQGINISPPTASANAQLTTMLSTLTMSIGLPYFMLSTTGPLLQSWLSRTGKTAVPYRLYALSNLGSLLALLSYPLLLEPSLAVSDQTGLWQGGFILLALLLGIQVWQLWPHQLQLKPASDNVNQSSISQQLLWLMLSAAGVMILVSTTSAMTQNVPPIPFLWILPLSLYLLSYIICFHQLRWYKRWYWLVLFLLSCVTAILMFFAGSQFDLPTQLVMYSVILFSACMLCHGELASLKPDASQLTRFYFILALGGVIGSAFISFIAVNLFDLFYEFPLAMALILCLLLYRLFLPDCNNSALRSLTAIKAMKLATVLALCLLVPGFFVLNQGYLHQDVARDRNFYGILSVKDVTSDDDSERRLIDGTTSHGTQSLNPELKHIAKSYYRPGTGVALALKHKAAEQSLKVGIVGLGAGTLAAYGKSGDYFRFYELNPLVAKMAKDHFSYIADSAADIDIILGDARLSLQQELAQGQKQAFDILVVDAFSGDAIPSHLLTTQALELYWQQLKADGLIAFHISNSHLDLTPLMRGLIKNQQSFGAFFHTQAQGNEIHDTLWVLMAKQPDFFEQSIIKLQTSPWPNDKAPLLWRDDYSNLWSLLR